jgi:hypothetical protein
MNLTFGINIIITFPIYGTIWLKTVDKYIFKITYLEYICKSYFLKKLIMKYLAF